MNVAKPRPNAIATVPSPCVTIHVPFILPTNSPRNRTPHKCSLCLQQRVEASRAEDGSLAGESIALVGHLLYVVVDVRRRDIYVGCTRKHPIVSLYSPLMYLSMYVEVGHTVGCQSEQSRSQRNTKTLIPNCQLLFRRGGAAVFCERRPARMWNITTYGVRRIAQAKSGRCLSWCA